MMTWLIVITVERLVLLLLGYSWAAAGFIDGWKVAQLWCSVSTKHRLLSIKDPTSHTTSSRAA